MTQASGSTEIRAAARSDVAAIARLAGELGYPSTEAQVCERLAAMAGDPRYALFVAVNRAGDLVGWIHVSEVHTPEADPRAEITGLVVDSRLRSAGVGRLLVERGESWARERELASVGVHSNVIRERAHQFYERLGYTVTKSQKVFRKNL